ncbi:hypothetical protein BFN03_01130 [Rhodococcus sp. WMMA185]|uniref:hypothetical protein n=1 Tax=Rhodococcus sp. WMMA185 TaxID=679318 RepID=UPI0008783B14|nr:hypothetical protein [Rhodococcus sp. WMMA185]AOW94239.1 hypothetical protein BFN03_01130 [Rhodococcus sp. WMMA185]
MSHVTNIEVARARRSHRVLFIGNPTRYNDVSRWAMVRQWALIHGLEPISEFEGDVLCVIVTEDILDGIASESEKIALERAKSLGVPCISVYDTAQIWQVTARVRARLSQSRMAESRMTRSGMTQPTAGSPAAIHHYGG